MGGSRNSDQGRTRCAMREESDPGARNGHEITIVFFHGLRVEPRGWAQGETTTGTLVVVPFLLPSLTLSVTTPLEILVVAEGDN